MGCLKRMERAGVVPVVVLERASDAVATAQALLRGGIDVMEITFRTAAAPDAIREVAANCPDMLVGAGTVISAEQCETAMNCGAKFVVSPGFDPESVRWCREHALVIIPGCVTPTEIAARGDFGREILPGQRLRRAEGDEEPVRAVFRHPLCPDGRCERGKRGGISRGAVCRGGRRKLAVYQERYFRRKF